MELANRLKNTSLVCVLKAGEMYSEKQNYGRHLKQALKAGQQHWKIK